MAGEKAGGRMTRKCEHPSEVCVESSNGERAFICRDCGAADTGGGFGISLAEDLARRERGEAEPYPEGAFLTVRDEAHAPATAPGDRCAGYALVGPRTVVWGSTRRPYRFVQRLDLPGRPWGRFTLLVDDDRWICSAYRTKTLALASG